MEIYYKIPWLIALICTALTNWHE